MDLADRLAASLPGFPVSLCWDLQQATTRGLPGARGAADVIPNMAACAVSPRSLVGDSQACPNVGRREFLRDAFAVCHRVFRHTTLFGRLLTARAPGSRGLGPRRPWGPGVMVLTSGVGGPRGLPVAPLQGRGGGGGDLDVGSSAALRGHLLCKRTIEQCLSGVEGSVLICLCCINGRHNTRCKTHTAKLRRVWMCTLEHAHAFCLSCLHRILVSLT